MFLDNRMLCWSDKVAFLEQFEMFVREPIVLCLSLLSGKLLVWANIEIFFGAHARNSIFQGFSDALIFTFLASFETVFEQWGFSTEMMATTFVPFVASRPRSAFTIADTNFITRIALGYIVAYFSFFPFIRRQNQIRDRDGPDALQPEVRLYWLLWSPSLDLPFWQVTCLLTAN